MNRRYFLAGLAALAAPLKWVLPARAAAPSLFDADQVTFEATPPSSRPTWVIYRSLSDKIATRARVSDDGNMLIVDIFEDTDVELEGGDA